jgi:hypothetical protein
MMRTFRRYAASLAAMVLMVLTFGAAAQEVKKAYLVGMANIALVEITYEGPNPLPDSQTVLPRIQRGLKGHTLDSVREGLNKWYAAHPDQLQRPVIETIWFEMVVPGLKK